MRKSTFILCFMASFLFLSCMGKDDSGVVTPNDVQLAWADAEIGVLIHFDMQVFKPDYNFGKWGTHPDAAIFNPTELNTDQWLEAAME